MHTDVCIGAGTYQLEMLIIQMRVMFVIQSGAPLILLTIDQYVTG